MASKRLLAKAQHSSKRKSKQSHKRFQALVLSGQLLGTDIDRPEKQTYDPTDLRTEEERVQLLLWVKHPTVVLTSSAGR
jgi:hypothetical protein